MSDDRGRASSDVGGQGKAAGHPRLGARRLKPPFRARERTPIVAELELSQVSQHWVNVILLWVGFGTLAGLLAKSLIPGREPSGAVGTVLIGIVGSAVGPLLLCYVLKRGDFNPISPLGFLAAVGGALAALFAYRLVAALAFTARTEDRR